MYFKHKSADLLKIEFQKKMFCHRSLHDSFSLKVKIYSMYRVVCLFILIKQKVTAVNEQ